MDSLSIILQLTVKYWYFFLAIILLIFFRSARGKGIWGEFKINFLTRFFLDKKSYHLIKNVTIPAGQGTTQIDHIVVSKYGVFVVETKNMQGWIYGGEKQKSWTQKLYKHTTTFQNPLHQNYKHTMALAELIGLDPKKMFSVIAFIGDTDFKTTMPENVTKGLDYIRFIKAQQTEILGEFEVIDLIDRIEERRLDPSRKVHKQHVEYLRDLHSTGTNKKRHSYRRAIGFQLIVLIAIISAGAVLIFKLMAPELKNEVTTRLNTTLKKLSVSKDQQTAPVEPKEYSISDDQLQQAMEEVLRSKREESNSTGDSTADQSEPLYQFEIELHSGAKVYTDNAEIGEDVVSYSSKNGLIISVDRSEIKTMKKIRKN